MSKGNGREEDRNKDTSSSSTLDSRFSQTLRNVQGLLKGRSFPGKVLITRRSDPLGQAVLPSLSTYRGFSDTDVDHGEQADRLTEDEVRNRSNMYANTSVKNSSSSTMDSENVLKEIHKPTVGARATDSARIMKFTRELSGATVVVEKLRELAWSGVPQYLRPTVWRLLLIFSRMSLECKAPRKHVYF